MDSNHRPLGYQPSALASWAISPNGGDGGIRTHDPLLAGQMLSQLSYTPIGNYILRNNPRKLNNDKVLSTF